MKTNVGFTYIVNDSFWQFFFFISAFLVAVRPLTLLQQRIGAAKLQKSTKIFPSW